MKYSIERLPESRVAIDVEIESEQVEKALNRAALRISQRGRIPGFRPGKAPRYVVEARYGRGALYEEASDDLLSQAFREILDKGEFEPVGKAELEKLDMEPFSFRLIVPVSPSVTLGDYRALRFPEEVRPITDEDVQHALEHLQAEQTIWKAPDPVRPAREGDSLTVDLQGRAGEKELEKREAVEIILGDKALLPGFTETLTGAEVGQTVEVTVTLPEEIEDKELAGQAASYTVTIREIKEPEAPALDDDFARSLGKEETMEELRARLRREMEEATVKGAREKALEEMLKALVEGAQVDMPQVMVEDEADSMFHEQESQMRTYHLPMARYLQLLGKSEEEYRQELREAAPARLRRYLVLREFIRAEGLAGEGDALHDQLEERLLAIARGELAAVTAAPTEQPAGEAEQTATEPAADTEPAAPTIAEEAPAAVPAEEPASDTA